MPTFDELLKEFPTGSQDKLKRTWDDLPPPVQKELQGSLARLPGDLTLWRMLINLAFTQYKIAFGEKQSVAIVGPANVGKSTLYNQLIHSKADRAEVSPVPGTTRVNREADAGLFAIVDTPGADAVGAVGETEKEHALAAAERADLLLVVFDASHGIRRSEQELFKELAALGKPHVVVLNKMDLVRRDTAKVIGQAAANLGLQPEQIVPIAAKDGKNVERVLVAVAKSEPEIVAALGRALPEYRWRLAWTAITGAASTTAVIALTPLPIVDVIPLLAVQSSLVLGIARIYDYKITPERAKELAVTFGLGFLGRTLFQELSKLGGPPGWMLSAAIASSTTVVMGYAAIVWFERGEKLTGESLKQITKGLTDYMLQSLRNLGQRKPSKKSLQESVAEALEKSSLATDRGALDKEAQAGGEGEAALGGQAED
ncbi:MAG: putative Small GTP-binding protein [Anaerolineales bacterium]|nr:putative Small GTP-binding protein [Anaerolineales bacterium]